MTGLSKTLAIFVVSMSMISWPAAISAPSSTAQRARIPSSMARPHFGMVIGLIGAADFSAAGSRSSEKASPCSFSLIGTFSLRRLLGAVVDDLGDGRLDLRDGGDVEVLKRG